MDVKKIGPPEGASSVDSTSPTASPAKGVQKSFHPDQQVPEGAAAALDGLQDVMLETVQAVRQGDLEPDQALDAIVDGARESLAASLPEAVDTEQVLEYIRETLQEDPAFLALLEGQ